MEQTWKRGKPAVLLGLVLVLLMLLIAACGEADASLGSGGSADPTATPTPEPIAHPQGQSDVVIKIEHVGGFVMQETIVTRMPHFILLGDGSVITHGPQIAIYPAPALPSLQVATLTEEGIQMILEAARDAGLLEGDKEYNLDMIADAATTVFTITADGKTHTVKVYAAEMFEAEYIGDMVSEEEIEARQKIAEFQAKMLDYSGWLPAEAIAEADRPFEFEQLQVVALPRAVYPAVDDSIDTGEKEWPFETPLAEVGEPYTFMNDARCVVVEGDELNTLVEGLRDANEQTTWTSGDEEFGLLLRPLLPGEDQGCGIPQM